MAAAQAFETPLGRIPVDWAAIDRLRVAHDIEVSDSATSSTQVALNVFDQNAGSLITDVTNDLKALGGVTTGQEIAIGRFGYPDGNSFGTIVVPRGWSTTTSSAWSNQMTSWSWLLRRILSLPSLSLSPFSMSTYSSVSGVLNTPGASWYPIAQRAPVFNGDPPVSGAARALGGCCTGSGARPTPNLGAREYTPAPLPTRPGPGPRGR